MTGPTYAAALAVYGGAAATLLGLILDKPAIGFLGAIALIAGILATPENTNQEGTTPHKKPERPTTKTSTNNERKDQ